MITSNQVQQHPLLNALSDASPQGHRNLTERYNAVANTWDKTITKLRMPAVYAHLFDEIARQGLFIGRQERLLDMGIGTGALSSAFIKNNNTVKCLTGFDISSNMLEVAQANLSGLGPQVKLNQKDIQSWNPTAEALDVVLSAHTLEHVSEPAQVIRNIYKSLRNEGNILLVMTRKSLWGRYIQRQWRDVRPTTFSAVQSWMRDAGFKDITPVPLIGNPIVSYGNLAVVAHKKPTSNRI